jgi:predicted amidohydrolase YtcJ
MCNACNPSFTGFLRSYATRRGALRGGASLVAAAVTASVGGAQAQAPASASRRTTAQPGRDIIILAQTIHTLDPRAPSATGLVITDGRLSHVGSRASALARRTATAEVVDLGDLVVMPGFVDPHMHSNFSGIRPWLDVGPFTTADLQAARDKIRAVAAAAGPGVWVMAKMLDPSIMPGAPFSRQDLDVLAPNNPVFVLESNGHVAYANSLAMRLARVTRDLPDPPQSRFVRDANGELTGRLEEPGAFQPFIAVMPAPSPAEFASLLRADMDDAASRGCTALHDCGIGGVSGPDELGVLDEVMRGDPPLRYSGFLVSTHFDAWTSLGLRPGQRAPRFRLTGIKAWADGSNQGGTGYQREPYLGSDSRGALNYTPEEITDVIRKAHDAGWQLGVHANGDAAIDVVLAAFATVAGGRSMQAQRHRIEHCSLLHPEQMATMAQLGLSPSFLIGHVHYWGQTFRDNVLGPRRADLLDPCASALRAGLRISLHSDYNVTPIDPLRCIQNAVLRDLRGTNQVLNPRERITPLQAIRAMTLDAAWQCHLDDICGSLEVGKAADLVVLEKDPITVRPDEIQSIRIHSTWLDGEKRFAA